MDDEEDYDDNYPCGGSVERCDIDRDNRLIYGKDEDENDE